MIRVEVTSEVEPRTAPKRPDNQVAHALVLGKDGKPSKYPQRCLLPLWDNDKPLPEGLYTLAPASIYVDRFGNLALAPKLVPVASPGRGGA